MMGHRQNSSTEPPLVSVVIPVYNEREYLNTTLTSLLNQTYDNLQIIIVDDCSSDNTLEIVREFTNRFDDYKVLKNRINMGQSFSRNRGTMASDGKYIVFHDGDDLSTPDRIKKQVEYLEANPEVGVVGSAYYYMNPYRSEKHVQRRPTDDYKLRNAMARECMVNLGTAMFRMEVLRKTRLFESNNVEGYELVINVAKCAKLANLNESLYIYRINEGSRSQNNELFKKLVLIQRSFQAAYRLNLQYRYTLLSFGWLIYMVSPDSVKRLIRKGFSPTRDESLSEDEAAKLKLTLELCEA